MKNTVEHVSLQWDAEDFYAAYESVCDTLDIEPQGIGKMQAIQELTEFFEEHEEWLTSRINDALHEWLYLKMKGNNE